MNETSDERNDPRVERLLALPPLTVDTERALGGIRRRLPAQRGFALPLGLFRVLSATAATIVVAGVLTIGGVADSFLHIFEPRAFVAISISPGDLTALPDLSGYGTVTWDAKPSPRAVTSVAAAAAEAGFTPARPASLPAGTKAEPTVAVLSRTSGTFTFEANAARQSAARVNRTPPPLPAGMDGAMLRGTVGAGVVQTFTGASATEVVVVAQLRTPTLEADGVTLDQLRTYRLAQPGISPQLAAQLRAIADPASTLPVPVPAGQTSRQVRVQGVEGLFVGDSTGLGSGVIWRKGDFVYAVGGPLTEAQVLTIANSLR